MLLTNWAFGDKVIHSDRPEWGVGHVTATTPDVHEGTPCQRLTVRFERAGIKNLSSALARLIPAANAPIMIAKEADLGDPLMGGGKNAQRDIMLALPQNTTDPFTPLKSRLQATLRLFRFSDQAASLMEWAAAQTGLVDPLSRFTRQELEDYFKRWAIVRDDQLRKLCNEMKRQDPTGLAAEMKGAHRQAISVYKRMDQYPIR
jgi:hypothetical protein